MELLRYSSDVWGQKVLAGLSWDLIAVFFWIGVACIVVHALYAWLLLPKDKPTQPGNPRN